MRHYISRISRSRGQNICNYFTNFTYFKFFTRSELLIYLFISSLFKVDLHLAYKKPINVNNNTAYMSVNKLPSNNDSNKTEYLIVRQNKHVANRFCIT